MVSVPEAPETHGDQAERPSRSTGHETWHSSSIWATVLFSPLWALKCAKLSSRPCSPKPGLTQLVR